MLKITNDRNCQQSCFDSKMNKNINGVQYRISGFFRGSQISRFSSKLMDFFLAVLNFHDLSFNQIQILADCDRYIRITLSELVDQQFKIGNALK
jgi:hypothetical protein